MKALFLALSVFASGNCYPTVILGAWKYIGFTYEGKNYPPTDPKLNLQLTLSRDRVADLRWSSSDASGFCERKAWFQISDDGWLYQKVNWVNPDNMPACASDPDMQMGKETNTHYRIERVNEVDTLYLDLQLKGKPLVYMLSRVRTHYPNPVTPSN